MVKKLILSVLISLMSCLPAWCANKYLITGGGNWSGASWNTASNQSVSNTTAPTTSDLAILDQYSGNVVIDSPSCTAYTLDASSYTGTISGSNPNQLFVLQSYTLNTPANMSMTGSWIFKAGNSSTAGTWTPAGQTFPGDYIANGTGAKTLVGNFAVTGLITWLQTCNLTGVGYNIDALGGWTGTAYFNDASNNPTVTVRGGQVSGTFPNSQTGCILEPSVSDITFPTGTSYTTDIREHTYLIANASTHSIVHGTGSMTRFITFSGTLKTANMTWDAIYWASGSPTLEEDMYVGTLGFNSSTGGPNGFGKIVHVLGDMPVRANATISGTAKISLEGSGSIFVPTLGGSTLNGTVNVQISMEMNTSGTYTLQPKSVYFGGGKTFKRISGTLVTTGFTPIISGTYAFDLNGTSFGTLSFSSSADVFYLFSDLTVGTLNLYYGSTVKIVNEKELTATSAVNACANELYSNTISKVTVMSDYVDVSHAEMTGTGTYSSQAGMNGGSSLYTLNAYGNLASYFDSPSTFTVAFTVRSQTGLYSYPLLDSGGPQFGYIRLSNTGHVRIGLQSGNYFEIYTGASNTFTTDTPRRVVVTKDASENFCKVYIDGSLLTATPTVGGTLTSKVLQSLKWLAGNSTNGSAVYDEIVMFNDVKDATWVASDYNSGSLTTYASSSPGIIHGWHLDDTISSTAKFTYTGTGDNIQIAKTNISGIDASESSKKICTYYGTVTDSINCKATSEDVPCYDSPTAYMSQ